MARLNLLKLLARIVPALLLMSAVQAADQQPIDYLKQIKPILAEKCGSCHSARKQEAGLRLDTAALAKKGGESGSAIVAGNPAKSLLIERVMDEDATRMPPADSGSRLTDGQIDILKAWVSQGAIAPADEPEPVDPRQHWSFQRLADVQPPQVETDWIRSDLDRFLAAEHRRLGVVAVGEAPRSLLLRRLYLNLIGLPPTRDELREFLADNSPDSWERAVDRLLASPRYGERWARHFMDIWRYSDPSGYGKEIRDGREHIWRWRDWIVDSLNEDKGYDRMIVEMFAADEAAPDDLDALRATGFLARNWYKFNRNVWLDNIVEHTSKAFLGMTINCTRCHEHKYDPIEQHEYYAMRAIFETHEVRDDPFAADSGDLVRTYDAYPDRPTYLFRLGDEKDADSENPISAATPEVLGGHLDIQPLELPVFAYYPALRPENRELARKTAEEAVTQANAAVVEKESNLDSARAKLAAADVASNGSNEVRKEPAADPANTKEALQTAVAIAEAELELARTHQSVATSEVAALAAREAAELVKYQLQKGNFDELARQAANADTELAIHKLEELVATDRHLIVQAEGKPESDAKAKQSAEQTRKNLETHAKQLDDAKAKRGTESTSYQLLGTVYPKTSTGRRLAFAKWIANRDNPLTARVLVNHVWLRHFDAPLVERMFDFGLRSDRPQHAELLDWLANRFVEDGWSLKALHKRIAMSGAYRLSSSREDGPATNLSIDPDNHSYWRMNARRMEAEVVRDSVLYLGGSLDFTTGGPPIPYTQGQTVFRRSLYFQQDKERQMTFLNLFDGAKVNECYRRTATVAPQQALAMFNSQIAATQSKNVADQFASLPDQEFIVALFEQILTRSPSQAELAECGTFLADFKTSATARANLALVLFNHNDFVTIR